MSDLSQLEHVTVLIPALNPDGKMVAYVEQLLSLGFTQIVLVDDGSDERHRCYFEQLAEKPQVHILRHATNRGKGRALKTGFAWCLEHGESGCFGVVTADSDGQHGPEDTKKVALDLLAQPDALILGTRDFNRDNVPFKSRYGNKITTVTFALLYGKWLNDTQTGLRGIPAAYLAELCRLPGERFEYEIRMLIDAARKDMPFREVLIETIYIDDNAQTHFNPWKDSARIYGVLFGTFLRYICSSLSAALIDMGLFALLHLFLLKGFALRQNIILSTVLARVVSSLYNFSVNRSLVFRSGGNIRSHFIRYYTLAVLQMACSAGLVYVFTSLCSGWAVLIKILVDTGLFLISYRIQQRYVFGNREK